MKVLVVGSGGREHVLAWKIAQSPMLTKLYAAPGNAGIAQIAECKDINVDDIQGLVAFAQTEQIDLVVVGPEAPLVAGLVDELEKAGIKTFGPSKEAAQLEGSKAFSKKVMTKYNVPTAEYETFTNINEAKHYVIESEMPIVIKADGLAAGKGVAICETAQDAVAALTQMMEDGAFGEAGKKVLVEQMLQGEEVSILALSDGKNIIPLSSSQDHKRAFDNDRGPNTGGMGAYSPCPLVDDSELGGIIDQTVKPIIDGLASEGIPYKGLIYAGLMMTKEGPKVLEYNCRFGDPEAQAVLPRLKSDLLKVLTEIANGKLETQELEWHPKSCINVVLASGGYPGSYKKGLPISGLKTLDAKEDVFVFHAGTALNEKGEVVTAGGRVLAVAVLGETLKAAYEQVYKYVGEIKFEKCSYRRDIGRKAIEVLK